jgi:dephospho-CoA kinase
VRDGAVDRALLGDRVLGDPEALNRLNGIVWPLMGAARQRFLEAAEARKAEFVVLDIPLLLETGGESKVDAVVVVSAPSDIQRERVLAREGVTPAKFEAILAAQMPDAEKRRRADFVIDTGEGLEGARRQVREVLAALRSGGSREH